jgi:hypothetical protein
VTSTEETGRREDSGGPEVPRSGRGCFTLVLAAVLVPLLVLAAILGHQAWTLYGFTSPTAVPVPVRVSTPDEVESVEKRLADFERGGPGSRIEVGADEINALIAGTPEGRRYAGKVFARIEGGSVFADVSLSLRELDFDLLADRWINGTVALQVRTPSATSGKKGPGKKDSPASTALGGYGLYVDGLTVGGKRLPEAYLSRLQDMDLLELIPAETLSRLGGRVSKVEVRDGRIVIER